MPRKDARVRIERGLYRSGNVYVACATPLGSRTVVWRTLGAVGLMEARRLRDEFAAETRRAPAAPRSRHVTYGEVAEEWLSDQEARVAAGDLARSTLAGYRDELERHVLPVFGHRQIAAITPDDLVRWHRDMQRRGLSAWSIKHAWSPLRLVLRYAVRHYGLESHTASVPAANGVEQRTHESARRSLSGRRAIRHNSRSTTGKPASGFRLAAAGLWRGRASMRPRLMETSPLCFVDDQRSCRELRFRREAQLCSVPVHLRWRGLDGVDIARRRATSYLVRPVSSVAPSSSGRR